MLKSTSFGLTVAPNQVGHEFTWVDDSQTLSVTSDITSDGLKVDAALDTLGPHDHQDTEVDDTTV
ncbi:MAG: hypothetical protein CMA71_00830 [Euryarchaeota archaeon]|nr:hypothetical protein [Euryarchaeota archaeon]